MVLDSYKETFFDSIYSEALKVLVAIKISFKWMFESIKNNCFSEKPCTSSLFRILSCYVGTARTNF